MTVQPKLIGYRLMMTKLRRSPSVPPITVLHGHVHSVCVVWGSLALLVCLLLEGPAADPVLDRRRHHPRHAGESGFLL